LNDRLAAGAARHKREWGCDWGRDILGLVAQADLEVESSSRWHLGTTYLIVARPPGAAAADAAAAAAAAAG
jgi:methyltransferase OMS1